MKLWHACYWFFWPLLFAALILSVNTKCSNSHFFLCYIWLWTEWLLRLWFVCVQIEQAVIFNIFFSLFKVGLFFMGPSSFFLFDGCSLSTSLRVHLALSSVQGFYAFTLYILFIYLFLNMLLQTCFSLTI